ncbi:MAG: TVP38/TMEM64 family protein [Alphaproteobacteria bacterium]|jgi:phospholipase D1/2|nr:TVP38/TMEM64 family protein [Alphaproteobacteria bacterium]MBT4710226.1 TVP38/TMEM64 family protein [Alphaproteobacteria bacterium]MBT5860948.1 TVP38/TMEM64 family protein [Alphaproteobacteria bacterium]
MSKLVWRTAALGLVVVGLVALWVWGPLARFADPDLIAELGRELSGQWYSVPVAMAVFVGAGLVMAPQSVLIVSSALIFGPIEGFVVIMAGSLASAVAVFAMGSAALGRLWRDRAGSRLHSLSVAMGSKGMISILLIRLIPFAHFSVVSLAAGASHIRFRDFIIGTAIGMTPWVIATMIVTKQFSRAFADPTPGNIALLVVLSVLLVGAMIWVGRRYGSRFRSDESDHNSAQ